MISKASPTTFLFLYIFNCQRTEMAEPFRWSSKQSVACFSSRLKHALKCRFLGFHKSKNVRRQRLTALVVGVYSPSIGEVSTEISKKNEIFSTQVRIGYLHRKYPLQIIIYKIHFHDFLYSFVTNSGQFLPHLVATFHPPYIKDRNGESSSAMNTKTSTEIQFLGELPPLLIHKHGKPPERRQVNKRWLMSSVLVGVTSFLLMGGALFAALEGREQLTVPAQVYQKQELADGLKTALKGNHPSLTASPVDEASNIMMVSTVSKLGDKNVVKVRPFMNIKSQMATAPRSQQKYPAFNALTVFSESGDNVIISKSSDFMYGADVEGEVTLDITDFPYAEAVQSTKSRQINTNFIQQIRSALNILNNDGSFVTARANLDPKRFSAAPDHSVTIADFKVTPENVSVIQRSSNKSYPGTYYHEQIENVRQPRSIAKIYESSGVESAEALEIENILNADIGSAQLKSGDQLQSWFQSSNLGNNKTNNTLVRVSLYRGPVHLVSIARNDQGQFVYANQPDSSEEILEAERTQPQIAKTSLTSAYDAIYRSALYEGLTPELAGSLIKIFAFDVDFRSRISPTDELEVFVSLEDGQERPNAESEILYTAINLGKLKRRYYRFRDAKTGRVDYYDEKGKSAKKFLLRQPVPTGKFRSPYGMRRHPISRIFKMHWGVDFSAPRGTPILAAGNGVVEKAAWAGGNGKRTIIRHANGYETYYLHQTAFAKGIRPGARVRQGQIIGYVGSTGYSTGPHLHYEVHVNNNRVDPMRIRLPKGRVLKGEELVAFEAERDRINALVNADEELEVVSN